VISDSHDFDVKPAMAKDIERGTEIKDTVIPGLRFRFIST
jgi:hypothetical protein